MDYLWIVILEILGVGILWAVIWSLPDIKESEEAARKAMPEQFNEMPCAAMSRRRRNWSMLACVIALGLLTYLIWLLIGIALEKKGTDMVSLVLAAAFSGFLAVVVYAIDFFSQRFCWDDGFLYRHSLLRRTRSWPWSALTGVTRRDFLGAHDLAFGSNTRIRIRWLLHGHSQLIANAREHLSRDREHRRSVSSASTPADGLGAADN